MTMRSIMIRNVGIGALALSVVALGGCKMMGKTDDPVSNLPVADASAALFDARGADRGRVDIYRDTDGLRLELVARGFAAGTYGMHVHAVGKCDAPKYTTAGPHWNPTNVQHGRDNPMGAHHGDMPNLVIEPDTIGRATLRLVGSRLSGDGALLDADGAAFVIHARPDDYKTDPSGNSGDRIVCGVITPRAG